MLKKISKPAFLVLAVVVVALMPQACSSENPGPPADVSTAPSPAPAASPKSDFERDLQFIRNGQFAYVWVFSRQDGKPLDKDDAQFLRQNASQVVDWVTTDGGKRVIGGTNFDLEKGGMPELRKRFVVEDFTGK